MITATIVIDKPTPGLLERSMNGLSIISEVVTGDEEIKKGHF